MFLSNFTYDDYPYYLHEDRVFTDYLSALKACSTARQVRSIKMYAWDDEIAKIKWWEEPPLPLAHYFKERAQQLRDMYSYLRLYVSGGYDSYYALRAFLDNDIHLDEIVHTRNDYTQTGDYWADIEYHEQFVKIIEKHRTQLHDTKITVLSPDYLNIFSKETNVFEYTDTPACMVSSPMFMSNFTNINFRDEANIWSHPKTDVRCIDGEYYFVFPSYEFMAYAPNTVCFYISKHYFDLYLKQAHMIMRYLQLNPNPICHQDLVAAATGNPYFNEHQSKNYSDMNVFKPESRARVFPLSKGKNYFRAKALLKHGAESKRVYDIWKEYMIDTYSKRYLLDSRQVTLYRVNSPFYNLNSREIKYEKE
tara:strand:+ start:19880 stop:20971 length:1092 start_codon:yes stop_codon:yes gene_type:complete